MTRYGKSHGGLINITRNDAAQTKWLLSSHIVANYAEALWDLTGVTTGRRSKQHHNIRAGRRKENSQHLRNFINFFNIHNPIKVSVNELTNIGTRVIASDVTNVDSVVDIGTKIALGLDNKKLGDISLQSKDKTKTLAATRKSVKVGEIVVQMSSDQLNQRLLASSARDEASLLEILSHELSRVAPSLFDDNGELKKNNRAKLMNEISTILTSVLTESAFHVTDGCAWLYLIYWSKLGKIKDLYSSFQQTLLTECRTDIYQMSALFDGYTTESTKGPEEKRRKKNLASFEVKVDWNLLIPQNMRSFLTCSSSNNQQLTDLLAQKLFVDGIHVKEATGDRDMLVVKEAFIKTEEFDSVVVHSRDTDICIALLHHLDSIRKNVIMETKKGCFH